MAFVTPSEIRNNRAKFLFSLFFVILIATIIISFHHSTCGLIFLIFAEIFMSYFLIYSILFEICVHVETEAPPRPHIGFVGAEAGRVVMPDLPPPAYQLPRK